MKMIEYIWKKEKSLICVKKDGNKLGKKKFNFYKEQLPSFEFTDFHHGSVSKYFSSWESVIAKTKRPDENGEDAHV